MVVSRFSCAAGKKDFMGQSSCNLQRGADSSFLASADFCQETGLQAKSVCISLISGDFRASAEIKLSFRWKKN